MHPTTRCPLSTTVVALLIACSWAATAAAQEPPPPDSAFRDRARPLVLERNVDVLAAHAALESARARYQAAGFAGPLGLGAEFANLRVPALSGAELRLTVQRDVLTGARQQAARDLAAADVTIAEARLRLTETRVEAMASAAHAAWRGWLGVAGRLAAEDSLLVEAETALRTRFAVGDARYVDVLRLRTERLRVRTERVEAIGAAERGRFQLEGLVPGDRFAATVALLDTALVAMGGTLAALPPVDRLQARLGGFQLTDALLRRAEAAVAVARAARRSLATVFAGLQRFEGGNRSVIGPVAGLTLSLPFTATRANRRAADADRLGLAASQADRRAALNARRTALLAGVSRYRAARERLAAYDDGVLVGARGEREAALAAYRTGELSLLELLDFERALSRAEIERLRAFIEATAALRDIYAAADLDRTTSEGTSP